MPNRSSVPSKNSIMAKKVNNSPTASNPTPNCFWFCSKSFKKTPPPLLLLWSMCRLGAVDLAECEAPPLRNAILSLQ